MTIKSLHHLCIQTDKYEESIKFYTCILGFQIVNESKNFHTRDYNTWLKLGDTLIEMQTPKKGDEFLKFNKLSSGLVHMCFLVDNIEDELERIKSKGFTDFKMKGKKEIYTVGNGKLFKLSAPEGTIIEFRDNPLIE
ncbi:MAG: glyoxalase/bleomycin resistance/dioxygenase family protein [Clostridiaceae bacterium]|jgi:glyoxylase I family protein|nr:glyoxalase/bleomycin resistance/dioxygenase family protein [Clostridiaceae bacterium]